MNRSSTSMSVHAKAPTHAMAVTWALSCFVAMPRINLSLASFRIRYASCTALQPDAGIVHSSSAGCESAA